MGSSLGPKQIITDGLVLHLDAGNRRSYPGSGTTWFDLSGNGGNGTFANGATFNSTGISSVKFDGTNDEVLFASSTIFNTSSITVEAWVNFISDGSRHIVFVNWNGYSLEVLQQATIVMYTYSVGQGQIGATSESGKFPWKTNTHLVGLYDNNTLESKVFMNGVLVGTRSSTNAINYSVSPNRRISPTTYGGGPVNGNVFSIKQYNRALSAEEILQNYNATKERFTNK